MVGTTLKEELKMNKIIDSIKSGNYEVVDNQGVSVTGNFTQCLEKEFADLEAKLAESEKSNEYFADRVEKADKEIKEIYKKYNKLVEEYNNLKEEVDNNFVDGQKYNELKHQLAESKQEANDWKQRFESSEERFKTFNSNGVTALNLKNDKIEKLKQQLHDLPKKIVEDFYDEIRHRAILEDDYCPDHNLERKYGVRKCLLENIRTTILKKYGGEDESLCCNVKQ